MRKRGQSRKDGSGDVTDGGKDNSLTSHKVDGLVNGEANGYTVRGVSTVSNLVVHLSFL